MSNEGKGRGDRKTVEEIRHDFPMLLCEYITNETPHHVQTQEWNPN